jgi:hypothetical protein
VQESVEDDLGIAASLEAKSLRFQLSAQFGVIENLTVEDNDNIAVRTKQRLVTALQIENA